MCGPQILYTCEGPQNPRPPHPARDLNRLSQTQVQRSAQKAHTQRHAHTCTLTRSDMRPTEIHTHTGKGAKAHGDPQTETQMCSQEPAGPPMPGGPCNAHLPTHAHSCTHTPGPPTGESNQISQPHSDPVNESAASAPLPRAPQKPAGLPSSPLLPLLPSPLLPPSLSH